MGCTREIDLEYHARHVPPAQKAGRACAARSSWSAACIQPARPQPAAVEFYVIDGLQTAPDAPPGTRHVGFYGKVHHASLDGAGGIVLANAMLDTRPLPLPRCRRRAHARRGRRVRHPANSPPPARAQHRQQFVKLARTLPTLARTLWHRLRPAAGSAAAASAAGSAPKGDWFAPRTPLNVAITKPARVRQLSLPLAEARQIAKANDVTINDVVHPVSGARAATWASSARFAAGRFSPACR